MKVPATIAGMFLLMAGCSSVPEAAPVARHLPAEPAAALVFTPQVAYGGPALDLDRYGREEAAFAGYRTPVVTTNFIRLDDRQQSNRFGNYDSVRKRTISTKTYVQTR